MDSPEKLQKVPVYEKFPQQEIDGKVCILCRETQYLRYVPIKWCSANKLKQKCGFKKVDLQCYWNRTSTWVLSCKVATYFQNSFLEEQLWRLLSCYKRACLSKLLCAWYAKKFLLFQLLFPLMTITGACYVPPTVKNIALLPLNIESFSLPICKTNGFNNSFGCSLGSLMSEHILQGSLFFSLFSATKCISTNCCLSFCCTLSMVKLFCLFNDDRLWKIFPQESWFH